MKLVSVLAVAIISFFLFSPSVLLAESNSLVEIASISHEKTSDDQEAIRFALSASVPVKMFALKGDRPRLVIDFPDTIYKGKNVITLDDGELANTIRVGLHKEPKIRTRIVVDLSQTIAVDYKHSFIESENLLEIVLTRGVKLKTATAPVVAKVSDPANDEIATVPPVQKELTTTPVDEKPIPAATIVAKKPEKAESVEDAASGLPQLLEVSFDDSSNRGEMVLFHLNDFFPPTVSAIEKNNPRVLCDFQNMRLSGDVQKTINAGGKYVENIRTAYHVDKNKVRVVLDLSPDRDYDLQQVFFKNDNLFVLIVNELPAEKVTQ
jgi:AMIN domain